jgi:hypothetical protein
MLFLDQRLFGRGGVTPNVDAVGGGLVGGGEEGDALGGAADELKTK